MRWKQAADRLIKENHIDTVISVIAPDEALYTGYLIKKNNSSVNWIVYYIDAGTNVLNDTSFSSLKKALQGKARKWENSVLRLASKIIVMEGHSEYYKKSLNSDNLKKLEIANVPLLIIPSKKDKHPNKNR